MARQRNYQAEYARRLARGQERSINRSQARGHPGLGEPHLAWMRTHLRYDRQLEEGLKSVRAGKSLNAAAGSIHVAPERLRNYMVQTGVVAKRGHRWTVGSDLRPREMLIYSDGNEVVLTVADYDTAAEIGLYMETVKEFLDSGDAKLLDPFRGKSVRDVSGKPYPLETNENALYRLSEPGSLSFEQVYRIAV